MIAATPPTPKGERTREHLFQTALTLFTEKGYEQTTMRDIASRADCSLGLTYRYFSHKEELVLEVYHRVDAQFLADLESLPPKPLADQFVRIMRAQLSRIGEFRDPLGAAIGPMLTPNHPVAVLGERTAAIRRDNLAAFLRMVQHTTDAPPTSLQEDIALMMYVMHYLVLLFWFNDKTPDQKNTEDLLMLTRDTLAFIRRFLRLPPVASVLKRLAKLLRPIFGGEE